MNQLPKLPVSSRPDFVPLPSDPNLVTDEQRHAAFPGIRAAAIQLGRDYVKAHLEALVATADAKGVA